MSEREVERIIANEMHAAWVRVTAHADSALTDGLKDVRRKRLRADRMSASRLADCRECGVPKDVLKAELRRVVEWAVDIAYGESSAA